MIQSLALLLALQASAAAPAPAAPATPVASAEQKPAAADAAPIPSQAATPTLSAEELDKASEERVKSVEECVDTLGYFREDLKSKKADLDKEFKGKVPSSFSNLLNLKANRISKQQAACSKLISGADQPIDASMAGLRTMDSNSSAYTARRKKLTALRERLNKALKSFAAPN